MKHFLISLLLLCSVASFSQQNALPPDTRTVTGCGNWDWEETESQAMLHTFPNQDEEVTSISISGNGGNGHCYTIVYTCTGITINHPAKDSDLSQRISNSYLPLNSVRSASFSNTGLISIRTLSNRIATKPPLSSI